MACGRPDWSPRSRSLAFTLHHADAREQVHVMANSGGQALSFALPPAPTDRPWRHVLDTARPSPADIGEPGAYPPVAGDAVRVAPHAVAVVISRPAP